MSDVPQENWIKKLPNQLTIFRMAVVPVILILFPINSDLINIFCALLFAIAAMTDWLDGWVARNFDSASKLGALLDPIADKLLSTAALVLLAEARVIPAWLAAILLCREVGVTGLRLIAQERNIEIAVKSYGKYKTIALDVAIVCLMVNRPLWGWPWEEVGAVSLWLALILSVYSAWLYVSEFLQMTNIEIE